MAAQACPPPRPARGHTESNNSRCGRGNQAKVKGRRMSTETQNEKTIAFVLYPGLTAFDLVGPLQVTSQLADTHQEIRPVVVGERIEPMDTDAGVQLVPDSTF